MRERAGAALVLKTGMCDLLWGVGTKKKKSQKPRQKKSQPKSGTYLLRSLVGTGCTRISVAVQIIAATTRYLTKMAAKRRVLASDKELESNTN